jgi:hypothetical protein
MTQTVPLNNEVHRWIKVDGRTSAVCGDKPASSTERFGT